MPRVIWRSARIAALCLALGALFAPAPAAWAATEGPELGAVHISPSFDAKAETFDAEGTLRATLLPTSGRSALQPFFLSPVSWSGDGQFMIVAAAAPSPGSSDRESSTNLYLVPADGGAPVAIPGTTGALYPVGLPDGRVAFERARGAESEEVSGKRVIHRSRTRTSIWIAGTDGTKPRRLTPWRTNGFDVPSSVAPDGATLAFTKVSYDRSRRRHRSSSEARLLDLRTGGSVPLGLGPNVGSAAFSPDGTRLAVVVSRRFRRPQVRETDGSTTTLSGESDIYVEDLTTGAMTQVTSGPGLDVDPAWDPSGQRLAFRRYGDLLGGEEAVFGIGDSIYEVNADGSCLTRVLHEAGGGFSAPSWRPGPERSAGRIGC